MSYEEQIMSKDKYPSIFSSQMEAIVFIILQIFYATLAVLGNIRPRDAFRPIARERKYLMHYNLWYFYCILVKNNAKNALSIRLISGI